MKRSVSIISFILYAVTANAGELTLAGPLTQGGLVLGTTTPGTTLALDGKPVRVSDDGLFVLGFGREAAPEAVVRATFPDGSTDVRRLSVAKREFEIQRIDGLPSRKVTPTAPEDLERIRTDREQITAVRDHEGTVPYFASGFMRPVEGRISGVFGSQRILNGKPKSPHNGLDIAAPKGTPVKAAADGTVALTHENMFYTGKTVMLDHGHGLTSVYVHMDSILVEPGQIVTKGTPIGTVGMTGRATGPHLHWGVTWFDTHLDPALLTGDAS